MQYRHPSRREPRVGTSPVWLSASRIRATFFAEPTRCVFSIALMSSREYYYYATTQRGYVGHARSLLRQVERGGLVGVL